jgi:predicted nucleotidyltransferase
MRLSMKAASEEVIAYKAMFLWPYDSLRYADIIDVSQRYISKDSDHLLTTEERKVRIKESLKKIAIAKEYLWVWKCLPWVKMIAITGSTASLNALPDHDIDIWVVTSPKRIWITRFFDWLMFSILGMRRNRYSTSVKNKFCINFYKTDADLRLREDIAYAVQAVDSIILFQRDDIFWRILNANEWLYRFFPSWMEKMKEISPKIGDGKSKRTIVLSHVIDGIDYCLGVIQYIKRSGNLKFLSTKAIWVNEFTTWKE